MTVTITPSRVRLCDDHHRWFSPVGTPAGGEFLSAFKRPLRGAAECEPRSRESVVLGALTPKSRSDDLKVAVGLWPTETAAQPQPASRQRRLTMHPANRFNPTNSVRRNQSHGGPAKPGIPPGKSSPGDAHLDGGCSLSPQVPVTCSG